MALPVDADWVQLTNSPWAFSIEETRKALGLERLTVINDFSAQALAIPALTAKERLQIGDGEPVEGAPIGVIGPGTGLGVGGLLPPRRHLAADRERGRPRLARAARRGRRGDPGAAARALRPCLQRARAVRAGPGQSGDRARGDRGPETCGSTDPREVTRRAGGGPLSLLQRGARSLLGPARRRGRRSRADLVRPGRGLYRRWPGQAPGRPVRWRAVSRELRRQGPVRGLSARGPDLSGDAPRSRACWAQRPWRTSA